MPSGITVQANATLLAPRRRNTRRKMSEISESEGAFVFGYAELKRMLEFRAFWPKKSKSITEIRWDDKMMTIDGYHCGMVRFKYTGRHGKDGANFYSDFKSQVEQFCSCGPTKRGHAEEARSCKEHKIFAFVRVSNKVLPQEPAGYFELPDGKKIPGDSLAKWIELLKDDDEK
jgi:hypothetical protein